jgi:hypothetical protein
VAIRNVVLLGFGGPASFLPTFGFSAGEAAPEPEPTPEVVALGGSLGAGAPPIRLRWPQKEGRAKVAAGRLRLRAPLARATGGTGALAEPEAARLNQGAPTALATGGQGATAQTTAAVLRCRTARAHAAGEALAHAPAVTAHWPLTAAEARRRDDEELMEI